MCTFNMTSRESAGQPEDLSLNGPPHINAAFAKPADWKGRRPVECKEVAEEDVPRSEYRPPPGTSIALTSPKGPRERLSGRRSQLPARGRASGRPGPDDTHPTNGSFQGLLLSSLSFSSFFSFLLRPGVHRMREFELGRDHESSQETCAGEHRRGAKMCHAKWSDRSGSTPRASVERTPTHGSCVHA